MHYPSLLVAVCATAAASVAAGPLYLSVPARSMLGPEDLIPQSPSSSHEGDSLSIMLMSHAMRDDDTDLYRRSLPGVLPDNSPSKHSGSSKPTPQALRGRDGRGHPGPGPARAGKPGSAEGGTVTNNGDDSSSSGSSGQDGEDGTSTRGSTTDDIRENAPL